MSTAGTTLVVVGILVGVLGLSGAMVFLERRLLARFQRRLGPNRVGPFGLLQLPADAIKLLAKEDWIPPFADRVAFVIAPVVLGVSTLLAFAVVPVGPGLGIIDLDVGLLFVLGMSSLGVYGVLLAGWASASKYALLGGFRAAAQTVSYGAFLGLSAAGVVLIAGSLDLRAIVDAQDPVWFVAYQPLGALLFFLGGVAETHRLPFDLPESESELVAGYHTEYSGLKFTLFLVGEYIAMIVLSAVTATLFLGGWHGPVLPPVAWLFLKILALLGVMVLCRGALPRPRFDQLMAWAWKLGLPLSLLNLLATGAVVLALR